MNKKYERYIEYIVNDIEAPYFKNMSDVYGLKDSEYEMVLSRMFNQSVSIKSNQLVYDSNGNNIYFEDSNGYWEKREYDTNGNEIYRENSNDYWEKYQYDTNGQNEIYREDSDGNWYKYEYDSKGNLMYYENSDGDIEDNR